MSGYSDEWNDIRPRKNWTPTVQNCDNYMDERTGKYEYRKVRYDAAIQWMVDNGLRDGMTVVDVGAGMTEFGFCLMHDWGFNVRYIPVDGGIDGTDLETWIPPREAHFFVALELLEHLQNAYTLLANMKDKATIGVVISTPNPKTTDVIGMDPTHVREIRANELRFFGMKVEERTFYGGVFSDGKPDSLFGTWTR